MAIQGAAARNRSRAVIVTWAGVSGSTDLGKTAGATWVHYLGCIPPASMRAASLSHIRDQPVLKYVTLNYFVSFRILLFVLVVNTFRRNTTFC